MKKFAILLLLISVISVYNAFTQTSIFSEDFELGALPTGWSQQSSASDGGWKFGTNSTLSSTNFKITTHTKFACTNDDKCNCNKNNDMLITPYINFTAYSKLQLSFDAFYWSVYYYDGKAAESATIKASIDKGKTWIVIDSIQPGSWNNQIVDLSSLAGKDSVKIAFVYCDGNGDNKHPLFGLAIDNVKIYTPFDYDISAINININQCFRESDNTIQGFMLNRGAIKITSMTINYQIDNLTIVSENLNNLNLKSTKYFNYIFSNIWKVNSIGTHKISVWASNINGNTDQNTVNDIVIQSVNYYKAGKPVLIEYFTNASCGPCGDHVPVLESLIKKSEDFVIGLAYHTSWPGKDPMYSYNTTDANGRVSFYGVTGVPSPYCNGTYDWNLVLSNECSMATNTAKEAKIQITNPNAISKNNILSFSATVEATQNISGSLKAYIAVIEKEINFATAPGANGEKDFGWVMKKMLPDFNGISLPASLNAGDTRTISANWTFVPSDFYKIDQMYVVAFIQNISTKEVLWATLSQATNSINEISNLTSLKISPNPFKNQTNVVFSLEKSENVSLKVFNALGKEVQNYELGIQSAGENKYTINAADLNQGIYFLQIATSTGITTRKINIIK